MKLCIPDKILDQHLVALGKTGSGKSSALRHIVEHLLDRRKRVCVVDPKGDWWGLKSSADGQSPSGYPVVAFGDFKEERATDIPLNEHAGKAMAELVATGNRPCIVGFRGWMPGKMTRFWIDFASTLFNANAGELYLVIDEAHNFAPKGKVMDPEAGKCLHWTNRLLSEGRGVGVVCLIASQRPQKVHNDTLTCCETLVALRVIHAADRQAIKDWIDGCGDPAQGKEMLANVASLPRGEAYVWSPEIGFGPQRVKFPMFTTFDSFAPPQLQKKVSERGWGATDLDAVKAKLSTVIEEAKANDPRELKTRISKLQGEIAKLESASKIKAQLPPERVEVPVLTAAEFKTLAHIDEQLTALRAAAMTCQSEIGGIAKSFMDKKTVIKGAFLSSVGRGVPSPVGVRKGDSGQAPGARAPVTPTRLPKSSAPAGGNLSKGERAVLTAIAQHPGGVTREQVTVLTGYKRSSRDTYLQRLGAREFIEFGGAMIQVTDAGAVSLGSDFEPLPTGDALRAHWLRTLLGGEQRILAEVVAVYPQSISREELTIITAYKRSSRDTFIQRLSARQLISTDRDGVKAVDHLFAVS